MKHKQGCRYPTLGTGDVNDCTCGFFDGVGSTGGTTQDRNVAGSGTSALAKKDFVSIHATGHSEACEYRFSGWATDCNCGFFDKKVTAPEKDNDPVNHPQHYTAHPSGVECIQITEHMGFNVGNAVKYLWRADLKYDAIEDMKKAIWYIQREIDKRTK